MRKLDRTDIGILNSLQENARITNAELARSVNLSPTPCFNRVRAMEELGVIRQQVTLLSPEALGLDAPGSRVLTALAAQVAVARHPSWPV